jgi:peptidyl-tRNA hydrolase, PTH1 family
VILAVGLGNPGDRYAGTRHNVGFAAVERLAARHGPVAWRAKFLGNYAELGLGAIRVGVLEPLTYMNESGRSVRAAADFFKLAASDILVVHDELDLPLGQVRLKAGGGDAGHRGLRSLTAHLGGGDYVRVRVGIGRPPPNFRGEVADYVLEGFPLPDRPVVDEVVSRAAEAIEVVVERGLSAAMNQVNQRN